MTDPPAAVDLPRLAADLRALGVAEGMVVMVHTSLRALGPVDGGPDAVIDALQEAVDEHGTVVMPAQSWQLCDPGFLRMAPEAQWPAIRDELPVYDPATTPTRTMGAVAHRFRTRPGGVRRAHPHRSIAEAGPAAEVVTARHPLDSAAGESSPLGALVGLDGWVLLLGVTAGSATILHLAEERASFPGQRRVRNGAALMVDGQREWVAWDEPEHHDHDFEAVVDAFARETGLARRGDVADAEATLLPARALVDFAAEWFSVQRSAKGPDAAATTSRE